jgi:D-glycero-D-manno-heptose 1,7-bisphosphate phosphatase
MVNRAVFLDRDGVLNANIERDGKQVAPTTLAQFHVLPGVAEAVNQLKAAGFLTVVVTNQPDVATGRTPLATVEAMHDILRARMPLDAIKVCLHTDKDKCRCRKPLPGMLLEAAAELDIDLRASFMVGDRWRDTQAGLAAGCHTIFVDYGHFQESPHQPDRSVRSLPEAVSFIIECA